MRARINLSLIKQELDGDGAQPDGALLEQLARVLGDNHPAITTLRRGVYMPRTIDPHPF
jgi:hypothetical protein